MVKEDCSICCESTTSLQFIQCNYCDFKSCKLCTQRYILDTSNDPHCMSCKKPWSREYIDSVFTKKFVNNDLKKHRERILLDREKAMLPATQEACEREKAIRRMINETQEMYIRKRQLQNEIYALNVGIRDQENNIYRTRHNLLAVNQNESSSQQRRQFVRKCPKESCKGFLSTQWKCGLCDSHVCKDCNEILTGPKENHVCDENSKATVALLAKDTKPCPCCGSMIFKISGCSQMWCPDCHTTFDWNSGRIETGIVHNPHYYEWLRLNGGEQIARNHGDFECGGLPIVHKINAISINNEKYISLIGIYRLLVHIQRVELNRYHVENNNNLNEDLRINYMLNEIDESSFANMLQKREKDRQKKMEYYQIYQMIFNTGAENLRQIDQISAHCFIHDNGGRMFGHIRAMPMKQVAQPNYEEINKIFVIFEELRKYANKSFTNVGSRYKSKFPNIRQNWTEITSI